ncbi:MAG TPA: hypothetical protein VJ878_02165, partial [Candidatus Izemoplasmatales bacterium]|nr:hypothetical protein [Candidatus Izemoplasmatales bacterium]
YGIVVLEIIGAGFSIAFATDSAQRDASISNMFLGFLAIILFSMPFLLESRLSIEIPTYLKVTILLFIFFAIVLGNIHDFLVEYQGIYDKLLHVVSGITIAIIGFAIISYVNKAKGNALVFSPGLVSIFAFTFSMTLLVLWEFYEFFVDTLAYNYNPETERNMQRFREELYTGDIFPQTYGLMDTMLDLLVGFVGAAVVSFIGWRRLIIKNRDISSH